jgi:adenylosuccinate synthase
MLHQGLNILLDSQWGSGGKGKIAAWLTREFRPDVISACNAPNAGHTVLDGIDRMVYKVLPSGTKHRNGARVALGAGAVIDPERLLLEAVATGLDTAEIVIHPRAVKWEPRYVEAEASLRSIASTRQGAGAAIADKVMRNAELWGGNSMLRWDSFVSQSRIWFHEVAQGFALSIDHGSHYPHCTARNCTPAAAIDQLGMPHTSIKSIGMILRPFPIRVGNDGDNSSGGWYSDQEETNWQQVANDAGMPILERDTLFKREHTTVTKRLRRVASFSWYGLRRAVQVCAPTYFVLNFAQYVDFDAHKVRTWRELPSKVREFIRMVEREVNVPVLLVGTGEDINDIVNLTDPKERQ